MEEVEYIMPPLKSLIDLKMAPGASIIKLFMALIVAVS
jgi:hypothetical protein